MKAIMDINTFANRCGHFYNAYLKEGICVNNGYNCKHPKQERTWTDEETGKTAGFCSCGCCPLGYQAGEADCLRSGLSPESGDYIVVDIPEEQFNEDKMWRLGEGGPMCVLIERGPDDGYSPALISEILYHLRNSGIDDGVELHPILLEGNCGSTAFGFMALPVADEMLAFNTSECSEFGQAVIAVLDDMELETEDGIYIFAGVKTRLTR